MNWNNFQTYGDAPTEAFETMCNQLFERYLRSNNGASLTKFRVVNGAAGDGGIEAYGLLANGDIIGVQSKWFREVLTDIQFGQVEKSITTALSLRPNIKKYIVCIPRDLSSLKYGRGKKGQGKQPVQNHEDKAVDDFSDIIKATYPNLELEWWFENDIQLELLAPGNEGLHKFWFEKEVVSFKHLSDKFAMQKKGWLHQRYIPELHAQGVIQKSVQHVKFSIEYRDLFYQELMRTTVSLRMLVKQIASFIFTNHSDEGLNTELHNLTITINEHIENNKLVLNAIKEGNDKFQPATVKRFDILQIRNKLQEIVSSQTKLVLLPELLNSLKTYEDFCTTDFAKVFLQSMRLILGEPGTGKTHGLVNAVETHLSTSAPAIIIQAKGASSKDWDSLLRDALALPAWNKEEICSALETMAMRTDIGLANSLNAGEEIAREATKVLVCIDGLEEDPGKEKIWYERMREGEILHERYPNIRFLFSARRYFYDTGEAPKGPGFEAIMLPQEGDVPVLSVVDAYLQFYNITLESPTLIKGIDSLFALRLFCDIYKGKTLSKDEEISTASDELLYKKIESLEAEFRERKNMTVSKSRSPIQDSLYMIADHFYDEPNIEHDELSIKLKNGIGSYISDVDSVIDFLAENGILIKSELVEPGQGVIRRKKYIYTVLSNSIVELILANQVSEKLWSGEIVAIPADLIRDTSVIYESTPGEEYPSPNLILQNVVELQFKKTGRLIGDGGFLVDGLGQDDIRALRMHALIKMPRQQAANYQDEIQEMFLRPGVEQYETLMDLVLPASQNNENYFGAGFLDDVLKSQPSAFERDKIWSGLDPYEINGSGSQNKYDYSIRAALEDFTGGDFTLSQYALHDEMPLIYAWSLSHINQGFRDKLRVALTRWALLRPIEFRLLLMQMFHCDDPQIQEDLSSVMLGVASKLKDHDAIQSLAHWAIEHVFSQPEQHRNIIVRQGMRAIVEKAFQLGLINKDQIVKARPRKLEEVKMISLDEEALEKPREEIYPIVHDLAWYVLKKSFEDFLEYPHGRGPGQVEDQDCQEGKELLDLYRAKFAMSRLFAYEWAMAAAIAYIRSLGFSRTEGNGMTQQSHGGKSALFTYEEKYTWLAVHYLQGYLSDYVPREDFGHTRTFVTDYSLLEPIPNPLESPSYIHELTNLRERRLWVLQDSLSEEISDGESPEDFIKREVDKEPEINFKLWLEFKEDDFIINGSNTEQLAIYNSSSFLESKALVFGRLEARACIIQKDQLKELVHEIKHRPRNLYFLESLEQLQANPQTHTHSNPSDLVWMSWIGESEKSSVFYDQSNSEQEIIHSLTDVTKNTIEGEEYLKIPSAFVRELCGIVEMEGNDFLNKDGQVVAFLHANNEGSNRQEMVVINKKLFLEALDKKGLELIWFVEHFKRKNSQNKGIDHIDHIQKVRKYLVAYKNGSYSAMKFWDSWASNK